VDTNGQADKERIHVLVNGGTFKYFNQPGADTGGGAGGHSPPPDIFREGRSPSPEISRQKMFPI